MSSSKANLAPRQMLITQMNTNLSLKIANTLQSKKKNEKPIQSASSRRKSQIHQIINLQKQDIQNRISSARVFQGRNQQIFTSQIAKKCGAFFNWINQVDYKIFAEQIWKNKMMKVMGERFGELTTQQQQRLIDRDWKIMAFERKQQIYKSMEKEIQFEQLNKMINEDFQRERNQIYLEFNGKQRNLIG